MNPWQRRIDNWSHLAMNAGTVLMMAALLGAVISGPPDWSDGK